ncbi:winged helix-turn-helix domain-containing protein [Mycobacteroides abscessus]|uniref:winged helix-turn-helix domain-containing protein n=1 Tax=Mycobacteroides abscessus TaxID=36809 RepID=UPI00138FD7ED|nr:winged helix-turn-helix domain-containing protein [Mycobacteroides abscessus]
MCAQRLRCAHSDVDATSAEQHLIGHAARCRSNVRELERTIYQAAACAGLSLERISDIVGIHSPSTIQRILRRFTANPSLLHQTPSELIDRRAAGLVTDAQTMNVLLGWNYTFGAVARVKGVATDGYETGDWEDIELAYYRNLISDNEFQQLTARRLMD